MKLDLKLPYNKDYKAGYLNINKEPRRVVSLVKNDGTKSSTSYSRYLFSVSIGRYLDVDEHVDHIDGNKLNDTIENLQILSQTENNIKSIIERGKSMETLDFICPICSKVFSRRKSNYTYRPNFIPTCSRKCGRVSAAEKLKSNR